MGDDRLLPMVAFVVRSDGKLSQFPSRPNIITIHKTIHIQNIFHHYRISQTNFLFIRPRLIASIKNHNEAGAAHNDRLLYKI